MGGVFRLLLLFIAIPLLELALLVQIGRIVGLIPTLVLVFTTGILGAYLARNQGLEVLEKIRHELSQGRMPAESLVEGLLILVAGAVLLTPGLLTDLMGFLCLIPATRRLIRKVLWKKFESLAQRHRVDVVRPRDEDVIDIEPL